MRVHLINVAAGADLSTAAAQSLLQNMQVAGSKVLIENRVDVWRDGAVSIGHEISGKVKTAALAEVGSGHGQTTSDGYPRWHPTNTEHDHHSCKHRYHFTVNRTVAGGAGGGLIPRVFSGAHFHPYSGVQSQSGGKRNSSGDHKVTYQVCAIIFVRF